MPHKFKIYDIISYRPRNRLASAPRGTYVGTGLKPALDGQQPEYRIRHFSEEFERVAFENELTVA